MEKNCLNRCQEMMSSHPKGKILKIINTKDSFGDNPFSFGLEHLMGYYKFHFVVEDGTQIFDPFLEEPIPKQEYLIRVYKNHDELDFVSQ